MGRARNHNDSAPSLGGSGKRPGFRADAQLAAWGNKMDYVRREITLDDYPWSYGIACELVAGRSPIDLIPPYNLLHYGSAGPYFAKGK